MGNEREEEDGKDHRGEEDGLVRAQGKREAENDATHGDSELPVEVWFRVCLGFLGLGLGLG